MMATVSQPLKVEMITVSSTLTFMMVKFIRNGDQNVQEFARNVLSDTTLTRSTNALLYQLVALKLITTESVLNASSVTNLIKKEYVSFPFQTQMTTAPNTSSSIQTVNGTTEHSEAARRSAKFVKPVINSMLKESAFLLTLTALNTSSSSARNVLKDSTLTNSTDVSCYQLVVLKPNQMETALNAKLDMNSTKMTFVLLPLQTLMITVKFTNTLITLALGSAPAEEDARRSAKSVKLDTNLIMESVFQLSKLQLLQIHFAPDSLLMDHVKSVHTDQSDNQTEHANWYQVNVPLGTMLQAHAQAAT